MKTTERFEKAVKVLYNAFHENVLNPYNCQACAVGNMLGHGNWQGHGLYTDDDKKMKIRHDKKKAIRLGGMFNFLSSKPTTSSAVNFSGYSSEELFKVESQFLKAFEGSKAIPDGFGFDDDYENKKEDQFKGLCNVVKYLASLDNIPNPLDYTKLFETDEVGKAKYELTV